MLDGEADHDGGSGRMMIDDGDDDDDDDDDKVGLLGGLKQVSRFK